MSRRRMASQDVEAMPSHTNTGLAVAGPTLVVGR